VLAAAACARPVDLVATASDAAHDDAPPPNDAGKDLAVPEIGDPNPVPHPACAPGTRIVALGESNMLYAFDPGTNDVTELGAVSCPELGDPKLLAVAVDDQQFMYFAGADAQIVMLPSGATKGCKQFGKLPTGPPTGSVAFTVWNELKPLMYLGLDQVLFRSSPDPPPYWQVVGKLASDPIVALVGTGYTRLYAVLPPVTKSDYRIAWLDPETGAPGSAVLVPAGALAPDPSGPAGFALWGDTLLIFTAKQVATYAFSTGDTGARAAQISVPILGAASPPCASTLD
jgi:hypothetical protein